MNFKRLPTIPEPEELLERAFRRAREEGQRAKAEGGASYVRMRRGESKKVAVAAGTVRRELKRIINTIPTLESLPPFYFELIDVLVGTHRLKKALGALSFVASASARLEGEYRRRIRTARKSEEMQSLRREFYGRIASLVKQIKEPLEFLTEARARLKELPALENEFTVVIAGAPNVGKSTLLRALTGAKVRVESYPFTTKQILLGYFERDYERYQIVDTPGLLDRPLEKRNPIEKQAVLALKHLANVVLFVFDPSETCGYKAQEQASIYCEVKSNFRAAIVPIVNKADLLSPERLEKFEALLGEPTLRCSAEKREGIEEIAEKIVAARKSSF